MRRRPCHSDPISFLLPILCILLTFLTIEVRASIHEYKNEAFTPRFNSFFFHGGSEGLYASEVHGTPDDNAPLNGKSFIRFDSIVFRRLKEIAKKWNDLQQSTGSLANDGSSKVGDVIIGQDPDNRGWPKHLQTSFDGQNDEAKMLPQTVEINRTGMYYLYFMFCDPQLQGTSMSGRTVWRNPEDYLPGKMAPMMTFYGLMSLAYLILGLVWFVRFVQYWKDIIQLQCDYCYWSGNV